MLHYLDVAIGFTLAMMVLASLVGTTTAIWLAAIRSKVRNLESGLTQVLGTLGGALSEADQLAIVQSLLRDKMMSSWSPVRWLGLGATDAVGREEFVLMLLRRAGDGGAWTKAGDAIKTITTKEPEEILRAVEAAILKEEAAHPEDPANVWRTRALAQEAPALAARLFVQFDDVLARADDNTAYSRKVAGVVLTLAFLVVYPVNAFDLLARLINDDAIAAGLADQAARGAPPAVLLDAVKKQGLFGDVFANDSAHRQAIARACQGGILCSASAGIKGAVSEPGVWTSFILLSLGVPFWQGLLDKLLGLRSKIAAKTEKERAQRAAQT
jgi:hypothetical protein